MEEKAGIGAVEDRVDLNAQINEKRRFNRDRLRSKFADDAAWKRLAARDGVKLPTYGVPVTAGAIEGWLKQCNITVPQYLRWEQAEPITLRDVAARYDANGWPMKAWVGMLLIDGYRMRGEEDTNESEGEEKPIPLYPVDCRKCGERLVRRVLPGSLVRCPKCGVWTKARRVSERSAESAVEAA